MRKGFVFILDALLAFLYMSTFIAMVYSNIPVSEDLYSSPQIYEYSLDLLSLMDKKGYLSQLAGRELKEAQEIISETPEQYCFYLRIFDMDGDKVATVKKHKCRGKRAASVIVRRLFVKDGYPYMAELRAWHKLKQLRGED